MGIFMQLKKLEFKFTVCKVEAVTDIDLCKEFFFIGKTDGEVSLVCRTKDTPKNTIKREDGWRGFRVQGELDFSLVGVIANISGLLAEYKISIFVVSTYNTDYVLVKENKFEKALDVLAENGYCIV